MVDFLESYFHVGGKASTNLNYLDASSYILHVISVQNFVKNKIINFCQRNMLKCIDNKFLRIVSLPLDHYNPFNSKFSLQVHYIAIISLRN